MLLSLFLEHSRKHFPKLSATLGKFPFLNPTLGKSPKLESSLPIVNLRNEESGEISIRYLSEEPSVSNSAAVTPRLEDLYLWLFPQETPERR